MSSDKLIPFKKPEHTASVALKKTTTKMGCAHDEVQLDTEFKVLECLKCGGVINPYDWIYKMATEQRHFAILRDRYEREVDALRLEKERLTTTVENLNWARGRINTKE